MLLEKAPSAMDRFIKELLPSLLNALSDSADDVVLMNLQVHTCTIYVQHAKSTIACWLGLHVAKMKCRASSTPFP